MIRKVMKRERSEERRVGKECRSLCDWSSDVCSSDLKSVLLRQFAVHVGSERFGIYALPGGAHDQEGHEEGEADEDLIRGERGGAEGLAKEGHDDDDPGEAGHHDQDGGGEGEDGEQHDDLHRGGEVFTAGEIGELEGAGGFGFFGDSADVGGGVGGGGRSWGGGFG